MFNRGARLGKSFALPAATPRLSVEIALWYIFSCRARCGKSSAYAFEFAFAAAVVENRVSLRTFYFFKRFFMS
jgi:hypothetical protein